MYARPAADHKSGTLPKPLPRERLVAAAKVFIYTVRFPIATEADFTLAKSGSGGAQHPVSRPKRARRGERCRDNRKSMFEMARLKVPVISIVIGEGSSGGALAIGVANKVFMLENAIYSILSPEGYSSILWKDPSRYKEAAEKMKLTAKDLYELNVIDKIIPEKNEISEENFSKTSEILKKEIIKEIKKTNKMTSEQIVEERYKKFRNIKSFNVI